MTMIPDNQLRTECFNVLVDHFGYLDTERFVAMMSRSRRHARRGDLQTPRSGETSRLAECGVRQGRVATSVNVLR